MVHLEGNVYYALYNLKINFCVKFLPSVTLVELAGLQENVLCVTKDLKAYRSLIY